MKRWLLIGSAILLLLVPALWGIHRLLWTPEGARFFLKALSYASSITIEAKEISGRMADDLLLEDVEARWPEGGVQIKSLRTRWQPWHLFRGVIVLKEATAQGLVITDQRPRTEPIDLTLPPIKGLLARIGIEVRSLRLHQVSYRRPAEDPFLIQEISLRLKWKAGFLSVDPLRLDIAQGSIRGALAINFYSPAVSLDLQMIPDRPFSRLEHLRLQARLISGRHPEQLSGPVSIRGQSGQADRFILMTDLGLARHRINLRNLQVTEAGRKGSLSGGGTVVFEKDGPALSVDLKLNDLDLSREVKRPAQVAGAFSIGGRPSRYQGTFDLDHRFQGTYAAKLAGSFEGNKSGISLAIARGGFLDGTLRGGLEISWAGGISVQGRLEGRDLQPAKLHPWWQGRMNLDLEAHLIKQKDLAPQGKFALRLLESRFQERALDGSLIARLERNQLHIDRALLQGRGFSLSARGLLQDRIHFEARISDLAAFLPKGQGSFIGEGWARWQDQGPAGSLTAQGRNLGWEDLKINRIQLKAAGEPGKKSNLELKAEFKSLTYRSFKAEGGSIRLDGSQSDHTIALFIQQPKATTQANLRGSFDQGTWKGMILAFSGNFPEGSPWSLQAPAPLQLSPRGVKLSSFVIAGTSGERVSLETDLSLKPLSGVFEAYWQSLDLARFQPWLGKALLQGRSTGMVKAVLPDKDRLRLKSRLFLAGSFQKNGLQVAVPKGSLNLTWDEQGLLSQWELETGTGGRFTGEMSSGEKARPGYPTQGKISAHLIRFDLSLLQPWLPPDLLIHGRAEGRLNGDWKEATGFNLEGDIKGSEGSLTWKEKKEQIRAGIRQAELRFQWHKEALQGQVNLGLEGYGQARGDFSLPIPARFPIAVLKTLPLSLSLQGKARETGLLPTLFPKSVQSTRGQVSWDLQARGSWDKPAFQGKVILDKAGGDLPFLGIHLEEVTGEATFTEDRIRIREFRLRSGAGQVKAVADLWLKDWKVARLQGTLTGENFQVVNRPGLRFSASPGLFLEGTPQNLTIRGDLKIPEALLESGPAEGLKRASPDVVILDAKTAALARRAFPIYGEIGLILGEKVRLKAEGLEALLSGNLKVLLRTTNDITAAGEIRIAQGHYSIYGQKLEITPGRFLFNGPPDNPSLDILALRTIRGSQGLRDRLDEIKAGLSITGSVRSPLAKLYSQPGLPEADILSYIILGRPRAKGTGQEDLALLSKAAGVYLTGGMGDSLFSRIPLDTIDLQTEGGDYSRTFVTVGKYLNPNFYLGLGGSLFSNTYQIILRYSLTRNLEIETKGGTQSGGNIYYKIELE
jgi:translocation and assembly module TamB